MLDGKGAGCVGGRGVGGGRGDSAGCTIFRVRCLTRNAFCLCSTRVLHREFFTQRQKVGGSAALQSCQVCGTSCITGVLHGGGAGEGAGGGGDLAFLILIFRRVKECGTSCVLCVRTTSGAGIAQWLQPLFQGPLFVLIDSYFGNRVIAAARKRSRSFCQKCRWQVTAKHTCTLPMWL